MAVAFIIGELAALSGAGKRNVGIIYILIIFLAVAICYGLFLLGKNIKLWDKMILIGVAIMILAGYLSFEQQKNIYSKYDEIQYKNKKSGYSDNIITMTGKVMSITQKSYGYIVEIEVDDGFVWVQLSDVEGIKYGATLSVTGKINPMKRADNPGNYDEYNYLHSNGVILKIVVEKSDFDNSRYNIQNEKVCGVEILGERDNYSYLKDSLYNIKLQAIKILGEQCDEKEMGLLSAIVLGEKSYMDEEVKELYSANAIAHVLSISGLHISVIGMGIYHLLRKRMRYASSAAVSGIIIILFSIMTGNSVSAVRAVIMFVMHVIADVAGRKNDMLSSISLSALFLLFDNPFFITNASFILSYSAILAVAVTAPVAVSYFKTENNIIKAFIFNISLNFTMLPVNMCLFYRISTYSLLLNLLVVPLMGIMLTMAILGIFVSVISPGIGEFCIGNSVYILRFYEWLCHMAEGLPESSVVTGGMSEEMIILYYGLLVLVLLLMVENSDEAKFKFKNLIIACLLVTMLFTVYRQKADGFEMVFLDVGQGECVYIHSKTGNDYLIDGGSTDEKNIGRYKLESFLEYKDVDTLEYVFISHCDNDHISGITELIEREEIGIEKLVLPVTEQISPSDNGRFIIELASKYDIEVLYFGKGNSIKDGQLEFVCLNPDSAGNYPDINESSMVLFMRYKSLITLFAGDIGSDTEGMISGDISSFIYETKRKIKEELTTIYKVAHHGSKYSNSAKLLEILEPDIAVISCGEDNSYGHPHEETLKRLDDIGALVLITPESKAVIVEYDEGVSLSCMGRSP